MTEEVYREYLERGPDALTMAETKKVLDWRDANPADAHRVRARLDAERRETEEREGTRAEWSRRGGDPRDFDGVYGELSAERKKAAIREMDKAAREASARAIATGF